MGAKLLNWGEWHKSPVDHKGRRQVSLVLLVHLSVPKPQVASDTRCSEFCGWIHFALWSQPLWVRIGMGVHHFHVSPRSKWWKALSRALEPSKETSYVWMLEFKPNINVYNGKNEFSVCSLWEKNFPPVFNVKTKWIQFLLPERKRLNFAPGWTFPVLAFFWISTLRVTCLWPAGDLSRSSVQWLIQTHGEKRIWSCFVFSPLALQSMVGR